jgi:hypothetical protein
MKILFLGRRYSYFRNFDTVIRELAARGHELHLAVEREGKDGRALVENLAAECPGVTFGEAAPRVPDDWSWVVGRLRHGVEHLRYQHRMFADTPKLRERSRERTPGAFVVLGAWLRRLPWLRRPVSALLHWLERAAPPDPDVTAYVEAFAPDILLVTPLIGLGSFQLDYLRAARALGIPTGLGVWSWDHLSSKALIRDVPDRVFVWNHTQRDEARRLHRVPADRIVVTGAQCFDKWFDRTPSIDAGAFRRRAGLPAGRPFVLYVCSAPFLGSPPEAPFVVDWIRRVRASAEPGLRDVPILVRPHPSRRDEWNAVDCSGLTDVVVWGSAPIDAAARNDYFDSLHHSAVVVGLNTSAFIEAGIVGRQVLTILLPQWHESQLGTAHFKYLFDVGGGLLTSSRTFEEHVAQLSSALAHPLSEVRPFVRSFVRPLGLDVAATPVFVEQVEAMARLTPEPVAPVPARNLALRLLRRVMTWRYREDWEEWLYAERELESVQRYRVYRKEKAVREAETRLARQAEREARAAARIDEMDAHRQAKKEQERAARQGASR